VGGGENAGTLEIKTKRRFEKTVALLITILQMACQVLKIYLKTYKNTESVTIIDETAKSSVQKSDSKQSHHTCWLFYY
jgi:hypothetical protein